MTAQRPAIYAAALITYVVLAAVVISFVDVMVGMAFWSTGFYAG